MVNPDSWVVESGWNGKGPAGWLGLSRVAYLVVGDSVGDFGVIIGKSGREIFGAGSGVRGSLGVGRETHATAGLETGGTEGGGGMDGEVA